MRNFEIEWDSQNQKKSLKKVTFTIRFYKYNFTCYEIYWVKMNIVNIISLKKFYYNVHNNDDHYVDWNFLKINFDKFKRNIISILIQKILWKYPNCN